MTPDDVALADARTQEYDRAARRHQLWLARYLESRSGSMKDDMMSRFNAPASVYLLAEHPRRRARRRQE